MLPSATTSARHLFISRAGEDREVAACIDQILRDAGYVTFLQDNDFGHTSFMARMAEGFSIVERGGRLIALLSNSYQQKDHCLKEARYPLIDDPNNEKERLIVFRIDECSPSDFLKDIPFVDLMPHLKSNATLAPTIVDAVARRGSVPTPHAVGGCIHEDPKIERLLVFLENEDDESPEKAFLGVLGGVLVIAGGFIAFDYFIDFWNWLFDTLHFVLFDTPSVIMFAIFMIGIVFFGLYLKMRELSRTIESANLTSAQIRELKVSVKAHQWKSKSLIEGAVSMATRNLTAGK